MLTWILGILFAVTGLALVLVLTAYKNTKKKLKELAPLGFSVATQNLALRAELEAGHEVLTKLQEENKQLREQLEQMDAWAGKVADTIEDVLADNREERF